MRKTPIVLLLAGLALVASPRPSSAQNPVVAHVPFSFVVDGRVLPPGDYTVVPDASFGDHTMTLENRDRGNTVVALFDYSATASLSTPATFQFATVGGRHYLSEVTESGVTYSLPLPRGVTFDTKLAKMGLDKSRKGND
jgi:hypothetical protein